MFGLFSYLKPLPYVIDYERQGKDNVSIIDQRVTYACQHDDAPHEAYYSKRQKPPFAPMP